MLLNPDDYENARQTRDPRFDGRFFVGVLTTGIYCRPVCPVRLVRLVWCAWCAEVVPDISDAESRINFVSPCIQLRTKLGFVTSLPLLIMQQQLLCRCTVSIPCGPHIFLARDGFRFVIPACTRLGPLVRRDHCQSSVC